MPKKRVKCRECGKELPALGKYPHVRSAHPNLVEQYNEIKGELWEEVEAEAEDHEREQKEVNKKKKEKEKPPESPEEKLKPPEIEITNRVVEYLREKLPGVYGINEKAIGLVTEYIEDNPNLASNILAIHQLVLQIAPKAHTPHLALILQRIPRILSEANLVRSGDMFFPPVGMAGAEPAGAGNLPPNYSPYSYNPLTGITNLPIQPQPTLQPQPRPQSVMGEMDAEYRMEKLNQMREEERRRQEKHIVEIEKLKRDLEATGSTKGKEEERIPYEIEGNTVYVSPTMVPLLAVLKRMEDRDKEVKEDKSSEREKAFESRIALLEDTKSIDEMASLKRDFDSKIDTLREEIQNNMNLPAQIESIEAVAQRLGMSRSGRTTLDVVDTGMGRINETIKMGLMKLKPPSSSEYVPKRTPAERKEKAEGIEQRLDKGLESLEGEEEFIDAAREIFGE